MLRGNKYLLRIIYVVSIVVPLLVALLMIVPKQTIESEWVNKLPGINALLNSSTAILLIFSLIAIKRGNISLHRNLMFFGLILGSLFLISYVIYHSTSTSTVFGDANGNGVLDLSEVTEIGSLRMVYLTILLSHIGLSIVVVPFVLMAFYYALTEQISKHKKLVKFTYPIWLYVSITGVLVYLMISPYYL